MNRKKACPECGRMVAKLARHRRTMHAPRPQDMNEGDNDITPVNEVPSASDREVLDDFSSWTSSPDGGRVSKKTSATYVSCMRRILLFLGGIALFNPTFSRIGQETFLEDTGVSAASLKPWFCALRKFITYLLKRQLHGVDRGRAAEMTDDIQTWSRSFSRQAKEDHHRCQDRDASLCPTVLASVSATLYGQNIATVNNLVSRQPPLHQDDFEMCRDYLALRLLAENGQRIGIAIIAETAQWEERKKKVDGSCTFRVQHHKTSSTHGSCVLYCSRELSSMIEKYYDHLKDCIVDNRGHLFPRWSGLQQQRGLLGRKFKKLCSNEQLTITRLRKATISATLQKGTSERVMQDLAASMNHTRRVAILHYDVRERETLAQSSSEVILQCLGPPAQ